MQQLVQLALVVADYDEAIAFYTQTLHFELIEDTKISATNRCVVLAPPGNTGSRLLLAKGVGDEQLSRVGNQTGGRVFLFIHTDDFEGDYENLKAKGVKIVRGPVDEPYGQVLVFEDLYGNLIDLIQPA